MCALSFVCLWLGLGLAVTESVHVNPSQWCSLSLLHIDYQMFNLAGTSTIQAEEIKRIFYLFKSILKHFIPSFLSLVFYLSFCWCCRRRCHRRRRRHRCSHRCRFLQNFSCFSLTFFVCFVLHRDRRRRHFLLRVLRLRYFRFMNSISISIFHVGLSFIIHSSDSTFFPSSSLNRWKTRTIFDILFFTSSLVRFIVHS